MSILFALRIHRRQSSTNIDTLNKLIASLKHSISFITQQKHDTQDIAIAIACDGSDSELKNRIQQEIRITHTIDNPVNSNKLFDNEIITFLVNVSPWSHFVPALNALLLVSADNPIHKRYQFILFQSLEVTLSREMLKNLIEFGNREDSLVCGVGFMDAHESFLDSSTENKIGPISGLTVPWNTCALWNTNKLLTTGFLSISEGLVEGMLLISTHSMSRCWTSYRRSSCYCIASKTVSHQFKGVFIISKNVLSFMLE